MESIKTNPSFEDEVASMKNRENVLARELSEAQKTIQELRAENQKLQELAFVDDLTDLYSRRYFESEVEKYITNLKNRENEKRIKEKFIGFKNLSIVYCDLNNFKTINDTFGHDAGDEILIAVSRVMESAVRDYDIVCRLGGDEFVIAFPGAEKEIAIQRAEKIQELFHKAVAEYQNKYPGLETSLSMGVVSYKNDDDLESLIKEADRLMYQAKGQKYGAVISN